MAKTRKTAAAEKKEKVAKHVPVQEGDVSSSNENTIEYVSKSQARKAIDELKKFIARSKERSLKDSEKSDLFADADEVEEDPEANLLVNVQLKKFYTNKAEFKPKLITLTKPYKNADGKAKTCLFLRDQFITSEEQLEKIEHAAIPTLEKILTLTQLKTIYKTFEKRHELFGEYDLFVVDDALLSSMPVTLGLIFYEKTMKFPIPIRVASTKNPKVLSHETLRNLITKALSSTQFLPPVGAEISMIIGNLGPNFSEDELVSNLEQVLKYFKKEFLVTVGLQAAKSPVLPLYYTERIYDDEDVAENIPEQEDENEESEDVYSKALLELADEHIVEKVLGKSLKAHKKKNTKSKTTKSEGKVTKP